MKLTACMYIRVMISYVRKYSLCGFRKINTHNSYNIYKKKKKLNINIASIFITLTEINNETHYVAKKTKKSKKNQAKTAPIGFALSV
jgi:hypothetical protein